VTATNGARPIKHIKASEESNSALPAHIAIIMDGNGRWAKNRFLPRIEGHRAGAKTVRRIVEECRRLGVRHLTLFAFSTENWNRPRDEVQSLMKLFQHFLKAELSNLSEHGIRLRAMGDLHRLPETVLSLLKDSEEKTASKSEMELILAVSYGGRQEIVTAARELATAVEKGEITSKEITVDSFRSRLYLPDVPDPDLLIRTSDENRISNFMLWQLAYSEIVVTSALWPDFSLDEFHSCLQQYASRQRRFGLTAEQQSSQ